MRATIYDEELSPNENTARAICSIAASLQGVGRGGETPGALEYIGMMLRDLARAVEVQHHPEPRE